MTTSKTGLKRADEVLEKLTGPYTFGMFMRSMRTTLDLSQVEMSKKLGITRQHLCDLESGRTHVSVVSAVKFARKGGFSPLVALEACLQDQVEKVKLEYRVRLEPRAK